MDPSRESIGRARRVLVAAALGLLVLGTGTWSVAAADETSSPSPTPTPTASPAPDPAGTTDPTPTPTDTPSPTTAPTPAPTTTPTPTTPPPPSSVTVSVNLYRSSAMVRQYTNYWCVPAVTQSMINLARGTSNRTYSTQRYYYKLTRKHNRYWYRTLGNDPQGWAWALRYFSRNTTTYAARVYTDKTAAVNAIAESIARTQDPVGVTVRRGTHAWVVLGYRQTFDPAEPAKKTLQGLYVSGPLGTSADRWPYRYMTVAQFREVFTRYHEWQRKVIWEGKWVVIAQ